MSWYLVGYVRGDDSLPNVVSFPIEFGGVVYGTKRNPIPTVRYNGPSGLSTVYFNCYVGDNRILEGNGKYGNLNCVLDNGQVMGASLVHSSYTGTKDRITLLPESNISGRFRLEPGAINFPYGYATCPVDFAIGDDIYNAIGCPFTNEDIYIYKYNTDGSVTRKALVQDGVLVEEFRNSIIDFGVTPQSIPTSIVDWFNNTFTVIYPNTFTVKNQDGTEELYKLIEAPTMVKGYLTVLSTTKTLVLTGANDREYTITWVSQTPEGKKFTGISFSPNSKIANIPIGVETYFNLEGDVSLYESYGIYRPPVTTFNVNLYQNTAEANRVDKSDYITEVATISGVLRDESSITDVTITFESDSIPAFNYVYIPVFNRYYFVNDITSIKYNLWQMSLSVDPLMTYKDAILSCNGFIDRNENEYNPNVIDKKRVVAQGHTVEVDSVTNELFTETSGTYVLNGLLVSVYTE